MLQRLNLSNERRVLVEKTHKHSEFLKLAMEFFDECYYFEWPDYPHITLFYVNDKCIFQIDNWHQVCHFSYDLCMLHMPSCTLFEKGNWITELSFAIRKVLKISSHYHCCNLIHTPGVITSFRKGEHETPLEEARNRLLAWHEGLSTTQRYELGKKIIDKLNVQRSQMLRLQTNPNLLQARVSSS